MEHLQDLTNLITNLENHTPSQESTPINLEILLSESIVKSVSVWNDNEEKYDGGFNLTGNSMSLKLDDVEYETKPEITHFILTDKIPGGGKGIFRRHFGIHSIEHSIEQNKMIDDLVIGDIVLNFHVKNKKSVGDDKASNVYLVLPIFRTEHSNQNGAEILKLLAGISGGNTKQREKDEKTKEAELKKSANKNKDDPMGFNQLQLTSYKKMSTNGFRDFETVNLTKMVKNEVPIIQYKINNSIFLIFLSSSINVSKHSLYSNKLSDQLKITPDKKVNPTDLKYYTNGIEVDTRKSMNCQPISDKGQVIKEINKGLVSEKRQIDIIEHLESLTKTRPGQVIFGVITTIIIYLIIFSSMNIVYKIYNGANTITKVLAKEFGGRGLGMAGNLKAAGIRGNLRPQNKGIVNK